MVAWEFQSVKKTLEKVDPMLVLCAAVLTPDPAADKTGLINGVFLAS